MKILMINKFLHPNGGSETYIFKLGAALQSMGHAVEYFGMEHEGRCVGNRVGTYTEDMDFHGASAVKRLGYALKTIYSVEARKKLRMVLDDFRPDVCHLNNFNYQLTPSIILEIKKWSRQSGHNCKIIYTAHDGQLVCPNHMMRNPNTLTNCEKCLGRHFVNCAKDKCVHGSRLKSIVGTAEAFFWNAVGVYENIDTVICCSHFIKSKLDTDPALAKKTVVLHNFVDKAEPASYEKKGYVLYFGRLSEEKGIATLLEACRALPHIPFVVAGTGPMEEKVKAVPNINYVGFKTGEELRRLISEAEFSVYPSECYENCPFSVMESQMYGTPVLGADIGGIPELIQPGVTGELFESVNAEELVERVSAMWTDRERTRSYSENCKEYESVVIQEYCEKLLDIYRG